MWLKQKNNGMGNVVPNKRRMPIPQTGNSQGNVDIYIPNPTGDPKENLPIDTAKTTSTGDSDLKTKLLGAGIIAAIAVTAVAGYFIVRK